VADEFTIFVRDTRYQVTLIPNGRGRYLARPAALPDCSFEAESLVDAIRKAHDAIQSCLDSG
jgi:predicted RNase H-like HicB family nuclease